MRHSRTRRSPPSRALHLLRARQETIHWIGSLRRLDRPAAPAPAQFLLTACTEFSQPFALPTGSLSVVVLIVAIPDSPQVMLAGRAGNLGFSLGGSSTSSCLGAAELDKLIAYSEW